MSREWKPGDVALVCVSRGHGPEVAVSSDRQWFVAGPRLGSQHGWYHDRVEVVRPLVVIDPEDREAVERLTRASHDEVHAPGHFDGLTKMSRDVLVDLMADALREFANPQPPKLKEPTGLGAVVEDASGRKWVNVFERGMWQTSDDRNEWRSDWDDVPAVRVLSPGVEVDL